MEFINEIFSIEYKILSIVTAGIIALAGLTAAIKGLYDFIQWVKYYKDSDSSGFDSGKRTLIKASIGIFITGIFWTVGGKIYSSFTKGQHSIRMPKDSGIIINKKTKIIHYKKVTTGNFPSERNSSYLINLEKSMPYRDFEMRIFEAIGKEAIKQKKDDVAIKSYILAINSSPLSYHLYDKLTRIYGRQKMYDEILGLHQVAIENLNALNISKKRRNRAKKEFSMRVNKAMHRAAIA